ncbi:MAG: hypothetical protein ACKV2T_11225 [Kofleriaceae bacterium]
MRLLLAILFAGCSSPPPLSTCADSLAGTWRSDGGEWMLLDRGASLEGYPLFDDSRTGDPTIAVAPRALDLLREGDVVDGRMTRRYTRGGDSCLAKVPFRVLSCAGSTLEVIFADTSPPMQFAPCVESARSNPSRREKWERTHP